MRYEIVMQQAGQTVVMLTNLTRSDAVELACSYGHRATIRPII